MFSTLTGLLIVWFIVLVLVGLLIAYSISLYNGLIQVKHNIEKAFKNIDVLLLQRHDELPKLIDTCKAYMKHEREILVEITKLRVGYNEARSISDRTRLENKLNKLIDTFYVSLENYPDLKANRNFMQIQDRISALETRIADRREFFNDSVNIYNIRINQFPDLVLAGVMNYSRHELLDVPEEKKRDIKMDFDGAQQDPA